MRKARTRIAARVALLLCALVLSMLPARAVLAQTPSPLPKQGTLSTTGPSDYLALSGQSTVCVTLSGTWAATVAFQFSGDNAQTWNAQTLISASYVTSNGTYCGAVSGTSFRLNVTAYTSGTISYYITATAQDSDNVAQALLNSTLNVAIPGGVTPANGATFTMQGNGTGGSLPVTLLSDPCTSTTKVRFDYATSSSGWAKVLTGSASQYIHICSLLLDVNGGNVNFGQATSGNCGTSASTLSGPWTFNASTSQGFSHGDGFDTGFGTTTAGDDWCIQNVSAVQLTVHGTYVSTNP